MNQAWRGPGRVGWTLGLVLAVSACSPQQAADGVGAGGTSGASGSGGNDGETAGAGGSLGGQGGDAGGATGARPAAEIEADLHQAVTDLATDVPFTLLLGNVSGTFFSGSQGDSSAQTLYESASTSKWVTAVIVLRAVERGVLELTDHPQLYLDWWTSDAQDWRSQVTLTQLLAFTSGLQPPGALSDEPCISLPRADMEACAQEIYAARADEAVLPGAEFIYGSHHMQVAGLMAMYALGASSWSEVFADFQAETGLFPSSTYDLPSASNPRLAGGMHWTGEDYVEFLAALYAGELLSGTLGAQLVADQTREGEVAIVESPIVRARGEMWHYAQGNWVECPYSAWRSACADLQRDSSPGAYGAYPFIDWGAGFYGLVARQGPLGSSGEGLVVYDALQPRILELVQSVQ